MSLENLSKSVIQKLDEKRVLLEEDSLKTLNDFEEDLKKELTIFNKKLLEDFEKKKKDYEIKEFSKANKVINETLNKKKFSNILKIKEMIKEKFENLEDKEIEVIFERAFLNSKKQIDIHKIYLSPKMYPIVKKFISDSIKIIKKEDLLGFIFTNKDETNILKYTFDNLIDSLVEENYTKIVREFC